MAPDTRSPSVYSHLSASGSLSPKRCSSSRTPFRSLLLEELHGPEHASEVARQAAYKILTGKAPSIRLSERDHEHEHERDRDRESNRRSQKLHRRRSNVDIGGPGVTVKSIDSDASDEHGNERINDTESVHERGKGHTRGKNHGLRITGRSHPRLQSHPQPSPRSIETHTTLVPDSLIEGVVHRSSSHHNLSPSPQHVQKYSHHDTARSSSSRSISSCRRRRGKGRSEHERAHSISPSEEQSQYSSILYDEHSDKSSFDANNRDHDLSSAGQQDACPAPPRRHHRVSADHINHINHINNINERRNLTNSATTTTTTTTQTVATPDPYSGPPSYDRFRNRNRNVFIPPPISPPLLPPTTIPNQKPAKTTHGRVNDKYATKMATDANDKMFWSRRLGHHGRSHHRGRGRGDGYTTIIPKWLFWATT